MSTQPEASNQVTLSEGLRHQFARLRQKLWSVESTFTLCLAASGLILSYLALFLSDRIWNTPVWVRVLLTASGIAIAAWALFRWSMSWIFRPPNLRTLSDLVQQRYRRLGDRLLGIVELAEEKNRPAHFSPALYRAAIQQVSAEASECDFNEAVSLHGVRRQASILSGALVLLLVAAVLLPAAAWNSLRRWAAPLAQIPRYTLVAVEGLPSEKVVPHGEPFQITGRVEYRSFWRPAKAAVQIGRQPAIRATVADGEVRVQVPGQVQPGTLQIKIGDATASVRIAPTHRPSLADLSAVIQYPEYLQYPEAVQTAQSGTLTVVEGAKVSLKGTTTRALAGARLQFEDGTSREIPVDGASFTTGPLDPAELRQVSLFWQDELGLDSPGPWRLTVETVQDHPPAPEIPDLARELAVLESDVLNLTPVARDDFGVRDIGLRWELVAGLSPTNRIPKEYFHAQTTSPLEPIFSQSFQFSPAMHRIPPDTTIELHAFASDYFPDREHARSPGYRIHVLGVAKHAELVRLRLEALLAQLEEVMRLEEKIMTNTHRIRADENTPPDQQEERIDDIRADQLQNARDLEQLAAQGVKTLREAVRNPVFTDASLQEWAKTLQEMQRIAQSKMQQAASSLKAAQQNDSTRPEMLDQAFQQEQEIVEDLERMQRDVNQGLDHLQALTLAQRLRKLSAEEKEIEGYLHKNIAQTIGLLPQELPDRYRLDNDKFAEAQEKAYGDLRVLEGEISRFYERTQKENYGQVAREMKENRTSEELDRIRGLIAENIALEAAQNLDSWSEKFTQWADILEPKSDGGGGGEGSGSGESGSNLIQDLIALLRLRERELNLRDQTRVLDQQKDVDEHYAENAKNLSATQQQLRDGLEQIEIGKQIAAMGALFGEIDQKMADAQTLLEKPQTDQQTIATETEAIQLLSDAINLINEQAQQQGGGQQSTQSEEMAFLLQMLAPGQQMGAGMAPSQTPGGSMAGGTTSQPAQPTPGDPSGRSGESRDVMKSSGVTGALPVEFRAALENYFNAVDQPNP